VIRSFKDAETERVFNGMVSRKLPPEIQKRALVKLFMLDAAESEIDLRSPPANHLERLKGDRIGEFSIRINRQWRICFRFRSGNAHDVQIEDYH
jgi:proteic killer suppression protein